MNEYCPICHKVVAAQARKEDGKTSNRIVIGVHVYHIEPCLKERTVREVSDASNSR